MRFLFTLSLLLPLLAHADKFPERECLDADQVKTLQKSFNINLQQKINLCDTKTRTYNVLEGLLFIYNLSLDGSVKVPAPYNQKLLGTDWIGQFWKHGKNILWGPTYPGNSCATAYAFADVNRRQAGSQAAGFFTGGRASDFFQGGRNDNFFQGTGARPSAFPTTTFPGYGLQSDTLYICPRLIADAKDGSSVLTMVETLMHESRHLEGAGTNRGYPHTNCKGEKPGTQGCDVSAQYRGAYATSMESLAKIGMQGFLVHPALRYHSKRLAYVSAQDRFVKPAVKYDEGGQAFLAEDTDGNLFMVDLKNELRQVLPGSPYYDGIYLWQDMEFAFINKAPPARITPFARYNLTSNGVDDDDDGWQNAIKDRAFFKRFSDTKEQRDSFGGIALGSSHLGELTTSIWGDSLLVESKKFFEVEMKSQELKLPSSGPWRFRFYVGEKKSPSPTGIYVTNDRNELYSLESGEKDELSWAPIANEFPDARQVIEMKKPNTLSGSIYFISKEGQLLQRTATGDVPVRSLAGKSIQSITTSFFHHSDIPKELD